MAFDEANGFGEFPLPPFPLSQSAWLVGLGETFFGTYERGITALLCLDVEARAWAKPMLPTQRCHALGSSFVLTSSDSEHLPKAYRIAGSIQIGSPCSEEDARGMVPDFDGLHLFMSRRLPEQTRHSHLRVDAKVHSTRPEDVMTDDWRDYLVHYRERLDFA